MTFYGIIYILYVETSPPKVLALTNHLEETLRHFKAVGHLKINSNGGIRAKNLGDALSTPSKLHFKISLSWIIGTFYSFSFYFVILMAFIEKFYQ